MWSKLVNPLSQVNHCKPVWIAVSPLHNAISKAIKKVSTATVTKNLLVYFKLLLIWHRTHLHGDGGFADVSDPAVGPVGGKTAATAVAAAALCRPWTRCRHRHSVTAAVAMHTVHMVIAAVQDAGIFLFFHILLFLVHILFWALRKMTTVYLTSW